MNNFPPFATNFVTTAPEMAPEQERSAITEANGGKKRGPRRDLQAQFETEGKGAADTPKRKGGRPKKVTETPASTPNLSSLFQILAGLQAEDVVPLTSCYELLSALPPEARARVLGMLNKVVV